MSTKDSILNKQIDVSKLLDKRIIQIIISILFSISTSALTLILIEQKFTDEYIYIILEVLSFFTSLIISMRFHFLKETFKNINPIKLIIVVAISIFFVFNTEKNMLYHNFISIINICGILAIPAVTTFLYWFYDKMIYYLKKYVKSLDRVEKGYLITGITILVIGITVIYNITDVFYEIATPKEKYRVDVTILKKASPDEKINEFLEIFIRRLYEESQYDTIYTTDTAPLVKQDVYTNIVTDQNDIRQPLFGVFAMPFNIVPKMIASAVSIIPNLYAILIAIVQGTLILITFTLIARLMKVKGFNKILLLLTLSFTYPTLLFVLNLEQYSMALFYMIVFIYMAINKVQDKDIAYIAATGSMLTTGILFPLLGEEKNLKQSIKNIFLTFLKCMAVFIISAKIILVFPKAGELQLKRIDAYSGNESSYNTMDKLYMYSNFVKNTCIFSKFEIDENHIPTSKHVQYNGNEAIVKIIIPAIKSVDTTKISIIGVAIFVATILSFILNRKDKFAKICFIWISFSVILLSIIGWGVGENGLILYTFYFSWAFICLIYKLFEKLFGKHEKAGKIFYSILLVPIVMINVYGIYNVIEFGLKFFRIN